ncbi:sulfurtransferase [Prauserella oleivorans]|uniref:Sulfurtransferase n=1 Tax=Prauserella oleivorans TaxID=1478153 RepID=A0ABW5WD93_9PSEU
MSTGELAERLDGPAEGRPALLDVRWRLAGPPGAESYREGHIPGAVFVDLDTELSGPPGPDGRHPLPDPADLERVLRRAGVRAGHPVVAYDDGDSSVAARAWWLLRWAGHAEVAVLDGGIAAWQAEGRSLSTEPAEPAEGDIEVRPGHLPVVDADGAAALAREGVLLDARAHERYTGEREPVDPRAGHVPGARNAPFSSQVGPDRRWRSPEELREHFAALGVADEVPAGAYCGSGINACSIVLAREIAGRPEPAALYAGSWSHWSADPARPAATGDEPG